MGTVMGEGPEKKSEIPPNHCARLGKMETFPSRREANGHGRPLAHTVYLFTDRVQLLLRPLLMVSRVLISIRSRSKDLVEKMTCV